MNEQQEQDSWMLGFLAGVYLLAGQYERYAVIRDAYIQSRVRKEP